MSTVSTTPDRLPTTVAEKLSSLRRIVTTWVVFDGLAKLLIVVIVVVALDLALDRWLRMDTSQRAICLALMGLCLAAAVFRWLVAPLSRRLSDDTLCLEVEQRRPELGQSLISAVEFSRMKDLESHGMSPPMVAATIDQGIRSAGGVNFGEVVDHRALWRNVLICAMVIAGFFGAIMASSGFRDMMTTWYQRNVLMKSDVFWPQDTYLTIEGVDEDGRIYLPRGDDLTVVVVADADHVIPAAVYLEYENQDGTRIDEPMTLADSPERNRFELTFKNVLTPFEFRARGGDDRTDPVEVALVARPEVESLSLEITPPAYTGRNPVRVAKFDQLVKVYRGSRIRVEGVSSKPLSAARLRVGKSSARTIAAPVAPDDARRFGAVLTGDEVAGGVHYIELTDEAGRFSKRTTQFTIKIEKDKKPYVRARLDGISSIITRQAVIPIDITLKDDFAVTDARLAYQLHRPVADPPADDPADSEEADDPAPETEADSDDADDDSDKPADEAKDESADEAAPADTEAVKPVEPGADDPTKRADAPDKDAKEKTEGAKPPPEVQPVKRLEQFAALNDRYGARELTYRHEFDIASLEAPVGTDIEFVIEATDNDDVSGPNVGRSSMFQARVVTDVELREDLARRERQQREELERVLTDQEDLRTEIQAALVNLRNQQEMSIAQQRYLLQLEKRQAQVRQRVHVAAERLAQILKEAINNRIEDPFGGYSKRMAEKIIQPLERIADDHQDNPGAILGAARFIGAARRARTDVATGVKHLALADEAQGDAARTLREVIGYMAQTEGYHQVVNLAYRIFGGQKDLVEATIKRLEQNFLK